MHEGIERTSQIIHPHQKNNIQTNTDTNYKEKKFKQPSTKPSLSPLFGHAAKKKSLACPNFT